MVLFRVCIGFVYMHLNIIHIFVHLYPCEDTRTQVQCSKIMKNPPTDKKFDSRHSGRGHFIFRVKGSTSGLGT